MRNNSWIRAIAIGVALQVSHPVPIAMADPPVAGPPAPTVAPVKPVHILTPAEVHTQGGSDINLPPGYFLTEPDWNVLDSQVKDLQDDKTRLTAQNNAFRNAPGPGWWILVAGTVGLLVGVSGGIYIGHKL